MFWRKRKSRERDLERELRLDLELEAEERQAGGLPIEEARHAARRVFGNTDLIQEEVREMWGWAWLDRLLQDVRYALRMMQKNPGVSAMAIFILALGIGANGAIFSVVNAVLLRPLPYRGSDRLVQIWETNPHANRWGQWVSYPDFLDWRQQNQVFEDVATFRPWVWKISGGDHPEVLRGFLVSSNLLSFLGLQPMIGRTFRPEEDQPGHSSVIVLNYGLWQRRFGSDPGIAGQTVTLDGQKRVVIGVMPPGFEFPKDIGGPIVPDLWAPVGDNPERQDRASHNFYVVGRLKAGIDIAQAQANMESIARGIGERDPGHRGRSARVAALQRNATREVRPALLLLLGAIGLVLLIACANVANLQLARATVRQREVAIRRAVGASRWRLVRQLLTENVLIAMLGGSAGLLLVKLGVRALVRLGPAIPRIQDTKVDPIVTGFTLLLSLAIGILFGLAPAWQGSKADLNEGLKETSAKSTSSGFRVRASNLLVIAEMALTLMVLVGAALVMRSFLLLENVDPGFNPKNLLTAYLGSSETNPVRQVAFFKEITEKIEALPGVSAVGVASATPLREDNNGPFRIEGQAVSRPEDEVIYAERSKITPDYFRAMGIHLIKGRQFTWADNSGALPVAIVCETLVRQSWPREDPLGKRLSIDDENGRPVWRQVIGVVNDTKHDDLAEPMRPVIYVPLAQSPFSFMVLAVRARENPAGLAGSVRSAVLAVNPDQPLFLVTTMEQVVSDSLSRQRFQTLLLALFAAVALILATVGIYAVVSFSVTQRTHEIAIRMALGARRREVLTMILRQGAFLALIGAGIGFALSLGLSRSLSGLLYGVSARDPVTFTAIPILLIAVALSASYIPARRAAGVDPMVALRYE